MTKKCLYLVSSSSSSEYVSDCLEALALPRGMIQHFRYRLRYIDEPLCEKLPKETDQLPHELRDLPVVVVYLYQVQTVGKWKPVKTTGPSGPYIPIRCGRLVHAFLDGEIAHFFFELNDYVRPAYRGVSSRDLLNEEIKFRKAPGGDRHESFAHIARDLRLAAPRSRDTLAFQKFIDDGYQTNEWRTRSLGSAPLDVTYDIIFVRIIGVFRQAGDRLTALTPVQRRLQGSAFAVYEITAGETYHIKIATHLAARTPRELPGQGRARLTLRYDPNLIRPVGPTSLRLSSFYDLEYWSIMPQSVTDLPSVLTIVCEDDSVVDRENFVRKELLCPQMSLPISILSSSKKP
jgi:hypothetical protein